jgi:hypothetical protein
LLPGKRPQLRGHLGYRRKLFFPSLPPARRISSHRPLVPTAIRCRDIATRPISPFIHRPGKRPQLLGHSGHPRKLFFPFFPPARRISWHRPLPPVTSSSRAPREKPPSTEDDVLRERANTRQPDGPPDQTPPPPTPLGETLLLPQSATSYVLWQPRYRRKTPSRGTEKRPQVENRRRQRLPPHTADSLSARRNFRDPRLTPTAVRRRDTRKTVFPFPRREFRSQRGKQDTGGRGEAGDGTSKGRRGARRPVAPSRASGRGPKSRRVNAQTNSDALLSSLTRPLVSSPPTSHGHRAIASLNPFYHSPAVESLESCDRSAECSASFAGVGGWVLSLATSSSPRSACTHSLFVKRESPPPLLNRSRCRCHEGGPSGGNKFHGRLCPSCANASPPPQNR